MGKDSNPGQSAESINGVDVPKRLLRVRHGRYFAQDGKWVLCTRGREVIATFPSLKELQGWWTQYEESRNFQVKSLKEFSDVEARQLRQSRKNQKAKKLKAPPKRKAQLWRSEQANHSPMPQAKISSEGKWGDDEVTVPWV